MRKILEQIIFKSLFEDTIKNVIKQAPRSVVDKARALKGYAFRIQSSRTAGTVDIATLVKKVQANEQYGENSHTSDDRWVYIFGADLRNAERKFFCNVLILPIDAAIKIYGKDGVIDAQQNGLIGTAPVYQEVAIAKPTPGQQVDKAISITKAVLSNAEPTKEPVKPGELEKKNYGFTDADGNPSKTAASGSSDFKNVELKGDQIIIKMPKDGFKYGIKKNDEFAKVQQVLIDMCKGPYGIRMSENYPDFKTWSNKFLGYGADGDYGTASMYMIAWFSWAAETPDENGSDGKACTPELINTMIEKLMPGVSKIKIIAESLVSYKPRYMTIIESKILQEQINLNRPPPPHLVTKKVDPKVNPKVNPKVDPKIQKMSPEQQKKVKADMEKAKKTSGGSGLMRGKNGYVIDYATYNKYKLTGWNAIKDITSFKKSVYNKTSLVIRGGVQANGTFRGFKSVDVPIEVRSISNTFWPNMTKGDVLRTCYIKGVDIKLTINSTQSNPVFVTYYYVAIFEDGMKPKYAWFPSKWFEIPK